MKMTIVYRLNDKNVDGVWYRAIDKINVPFRPTYNHMKTPEIEAAISRLYGAHRKYSCS